MDEADLEKSLSPSDRGLHLFTFTWLVLPQLTTSGFVTQFLSAYLCQGEIRWCHPKMVQWKRAGWTSLNRRLQGLLEKLQYHSGQKHPRQVDKAFQFVMWIHAESLLQCSQMPPRNEMRGYSFQECSPLEFNQGFCIYDLGCTSSQRISGCSNMYSYEDGDWNRFTEHILSYASSLHKCRGTNWFADGGVAFQVAELKMLKHVVEQISNAPLPECGRSFFPARIDVCLVWEGKGKEQAGKYRLVGSFSSDMSDRRRSTCIVDVIKDTHQC